MQDNAHCLNVHRSYRVHFMRQLLHLLLLWVIHAIDKQIHAITSQAFGLILCTISPITNDEEDSQVLINMH